MSAANPSAMNHRQLVLLEHAPGAEDSPDRTAQRRDRLLIGVFLAIALGAFLYNFVIATPRHASVQLGIQLRRPLGRQFARALQHHEHVGGQRL
jgi:hypothetical protein